MRSLPMAILAFLSISCFPQAFAESTACATPVLIIPDGRVTQSSLPQVTCYSNYCYWYGIYAQPGHSYSVEFEPPANNYVNAGSSTQIVFTSIAVFDPVQGTCSVNPTANVTANSGYAPAILKGGNGAGRRVSFTAHAAGLYLISPSYLGGGSYTFRAVDTTMFNMRWSTCAGYDDQWGFLNTSDMPITGTFTVYDLNNQARASVQFTIPAGGQVVRYSQASDLNLPRNLSGGAVFSHNGPPNSIIADSYMVSPNASSVVYTKFSVAGEP